MQLHFPFLLLNFYSTCQQTKLIVGEVMRLHAQPHIPETVTILIYQIWKPVATNIIRTRKSKSWRLFPNVSSKRVQSAKSNFKERAAALLPKLVLREKTVEITFNNPLPARAKENDE